MGAVGSNLVGAFRPLRPVLIFTAPAADLRAPDHSTPSSAKATSLRFQSSARSFGRRGSGPLWRGLGAAGKSA